MEICLNTIETTGNDFALKSQKMRFYLTQKDVQNFFQFTNFLFRWSKVPSNTTFELLYFSFLYLFYFGSSFLFQMCYITLDGIIFQSYIFRFVSFLKTDLGLITPLPKIHRGLFLLSLIFDGSCLCSGCLVFLCAW